MTWKQVYQPQGWHWLPSAPVAALPVVALLLVGMPWGTAISSFALDAVNGLPLGSGGGS